MTPTIQDNLPQDEFEPIELGSVSSVTKGEFNLPAEIAGSQNSRQAVG